MRNLPTVLCLGLALAGLQPSVPPTRHGTPDLSIGEPDETREEYSFAYISGRAFDSTGRMVVTDLQANAVRVYSASGTYAYSIGRKGAGPGEYDVPLGAAFSADGLFWVKDEGNRRFNGYSLGPTRANSKLSIRYDHQPPKTSRLSTIAFDEAGRLISMGTYFDEKANLRHPTRTVIDRTGHVVRVDTIAEPPADSLGDFQVAKETRNDAGLVASRTTWLYSQPYGATLLLAQSPRGVLARAVSSRYDITLRDSRGKVLRTIRRDVQGPPLSAREQKVGRDQIDGFLKRAKMSESQLPKGLPARKAPIRQMAFDQLERLWVERSVPDGTPRVADVYDASGKWIAIMQWPANINVVSDAGVAARGPHVLGVATDSLDVQRVVRLVFR